MIYFQNKLITFKEYANLKIIICKICLKKFHSDKIDLFEIHSEKCKQLAELNQKIDHSKKKLEKYKLECDNIKRDFIFETNIEKFSFYFFINYLFFLEKI